MKVLTLNTDNNGRWYNAIDRSVWEEKGKIKTIDEQWPSATTVTSFYPKDEGLFRWYGDHVSYEAAVMEMKRAGERGTRVHNAIEAIIGGQVLTFQEYKKEHHYGSDMRALKEWKMIQAFYYWWIDFGQPIPVEGMIERTVYSWDYEVAGTLDSVWTGGVFGDAHVMIDWKTSSGIHDNYWCQQAIYWHAATEMGVDEIDLSAIVQLGSGHKGSKSGNNTCKDYTKSTTGKNYKYAVMPNSLADHLEEFKMCKHFFDKSVSKRERSTVDIVEEISLVELDSSHINTLESINLFE